MTMTTQAVKKRAYRIDEAVATFSIGRSKLYQLIQANQLRTVKVGARRLILAESLEALLQGEAE